MDFDSVGGGFGAGRFGTASGACFCLEPAAESGESGGC